MIERWPVVGRANELAHAEALLAAGAGVVVVGAEGVGKTTFAREIAQRAAARGTPTTLVVARVGSARLPMEAFAAALGGPDGPDGHDQPPTVIDTMRRVRAALGDAAKVLLVVDDAHLLDPSSTQVLVQLAAVGATTVVATVRTDLAVEGGIDRLWRDGFCERIELDPLSAGDVAKVLEAALDGQVDERTARLFHARAQGNALLLRELVTAALHAGQLVQRDLVWRLAGDPPVSGGVRELVAERLAGLDGPTRIAVETVAATEPLALDVARELVGERLLEDLEENRLLVVRETLDGTTVGLAHPLYGEVLRTEMPRLRLHRLRMGAARAAEQAGAGRPTDLVRAALWRLEAGQADDPDRLLAAARAARPFSLETAERLARRAFETGPSLPTALQLAEILTLIGRSDEAASLLGGLPPASLSGADREALVYCAALGQGLLAGDPDQGARLVDDVLRGALGASPRLQSLHATMLAFACRFADALDRAQPFLDDEDAEPAVRAFAAIAAVGSLYWLGRGREAFVLAERVLPEVERSRADLPFAPAAVRLVAICARADCDSLDAAEELATEMAGQAGAADDPWTQARADYCLGRVALLRGRVRTSTRLFRAAVSGLTSFDETFFAHNRSMVARSAAAAGLVGEAVDALKIPAHLPRLDVYEPDWQLGEAAVLAAQARLADAVDRAAWAAELAASRDQWVVALTAAHDAARYGGAQQVLGQIRVAAARVDGPLAWCYLDHARALVDSSGAGAGEALDEVSRRFESCGALLHAAEAAAAASRAHLMAGLRRAFAASSARTTALLARCEGASCPWLAGMLVQVPLTNRERQVAALAAEGNSDAEIARRLRVSVRTTQTHLSRVYAKLGLHGRSELSAALDVADPVDGRGET